MSKMIRSRKTRKVRTIRVQDLSPRKTPTGGKKATRKKASQSTSEWMVLSIM